jgi:acetolactate synthase-1/2/3 large subunit
MISITKENMEVANIMDKIKLAEYVFKYLSTGGTKHVFGVPGGGCMHLYDAAYNTKCLTVIPSFNEQASALATQSYGEITNNLGLCLVTAGPGLTNAITGIAACWMESTPAIFIGGQAKTADLSVNFGVRTMGQQELDGVSLVKGITKLSIRILDPKEIYSVLEKAVTIANSGRKGPVFIEIPLDVQATMIDDLPISYPQTSAIKATDAQVTEVRELLAAIIMAKKPVILLGAGVKAVNAGKNLIQACEKLKVPVLLTWKVIGLLKEDHYLNFGRPGGICQPYANDILQNADLFISVGARNDLVSVAFDYDTYAQESKSRYFVDIDHAELKKFKLSKDVLIQIDVGVLTETLVKLLSQMKLETYPSRDGWLSWCSQMKKDKNILRYHQPSPEYVSSYHLVDQLSDFISSDHVVIPGSSGSCSDIFMQAFRVKNDTVIQNAPGLGAMGTGLAGIVGGYSATNKKIISMIGDGGFQFNLQELQTIKNLNINVTIFVLNNDGYASIRRSQDNHFKRRSHADSTSGISLSNLEKIAKAFGFSYCKLSDNSQIQSVLAESVDSKGQTLVEVIVSPDEDVRPRVGAKLINGKMVSGSMSDYK